MTSTSTKDASDAKRWLIIGAHQAGASEKRVARISGLSKTAVRHIILNYQRTGNPCLPKREPKKVKEKLLVEYDENGNLILSDDEDDAPMPSKKENTIKKAQPTNSKKRSKKLNSKVTAKDLIEYMMEQVKRVESEYTPIPNSTSTNEYHDQQQERYDEYQQQQQDEEQQQQYHRSTWCPTPPRDGSISGSSSSSGGGGGPSDSESPGLNGNKAKTNHLPLPDSPSFLPLSPPASGTSKSSTTSTTMDLDTPHHHDQQHSRHAPSPTHPPPLPSPSKYDQTIRGYELWTHKDDVLLLQHVLSRLQLGNWRELEAKFDGRHTARLCMARWNYLRDHLLKGIAKADASPW